jgi:hypothetical protein
MQSAMRALSLGLLVVTVLTLVPLDRAHAPERKLRRSTWGCRHAPASLPKRLVAWSRLQLAAGSSKTVMLTLDPHHLSIFDDAKNAWELVPGDYQVMVGGSSRDLPLRGTLSINAVK